MGLIVGMGNLVTLLRHFKPKIAIRNFSVLETVINCTPREYCHNAHHLKVILNGFRGQIEC